MIQLLARFFVILITLFEIHVARAEENLSVCDPAAYGSAARLNDCSEGELVCSVSALKKEISEKSCNADTSQKLLQDLILHALSQADLDVIRSVLGEPFLTEHPMLETSLEALKIGFENLKKGDSAVRVLDLRIQKPLTRLKNFTCHDLTPDEKMKIGYECGASCTNHIGYCYGIEMLRIRLLRSSTPRESNLTEENARERQLSKPMDLLRPPLDVWQEYKNSGEDWRRTFLPHLHYEQKNQREYLNRLNAGEVRSLTIDMQDKLIRRIELQRPIAMQFYNFEMLKKLFRGELTAGRPISILLWRVFGQYGHIVTAVEFRENSHDPNQFELTFLNSTLPYKGKAIFRKDEKIEISGYQPEVIGFMFLPQDSEPTASYQIEWGVETPPRNENQISSSR